MKGNLKNKIAGFFAALFFFVLITSILIFPGVAVDITLNSGRLSLEDVSAYEGTEINFNDVSFTVKWDDKNSITSLDFSIFNSENNQIVAYVNFDINGNKNTQQTSGEFNITEMSVSGGEQIIHPAHGYSPQTTSYSDLVYSYDISYTAYNIGTFYAKLFAYSTSGTHTSEKSEEFTIRPPDGGSLFDVELNVILDDVYIGENNTALIDLTNVGETGLVNATITRTLYFENQTIWSVTEDINISGHTAFNATIPTDGLEPGVYTYEVVHRYGNNQTATAIDVFVVKSKTTTIPPSTNILDIKLPEPWIIITIIIVIIIFIIIFILFRLGYLYMEDVTIARYFVIYKEIKQTKTKKLNSLLKGKDSVLKDVSHLNPINGVYMFEKKKDAYDLAEILEKHNAKFYVGKIKVKDEDDLEEPFTSE